MKAYSTLIKNPEKRIKYRRFTRSGRDHYHIGVWVDGSEEELIEVQRVEYKLHPSFKKRVRSSAARNNGFSITFWAWGMFDIEVSIYKTNGDSETFVYPMKFDLPPDDGSNYIDVSEL